MAPLVVEEAVGHAGFSMWHVGSVVAPGLQSAGSIGSIVVAHRLSCPRVRGSFWIRDRTHVSCIGRQIAYHWATRETLTNLIKWKVLVLSPPQFIIIPTNPNNWETYLVSNILHIIVIYCILKNTEELLSGGMSKPSSDFAVPVWLLVSAPDLDPVTPVTFVPASISELRVTTCWCPPLYWGGRSGQEGKPT